MSTNSEEAPPPVGLRIERDPRALPARPGRPGRWFAVEHRAPTEPGLVILWQPTTASEAGIYSVADPLGVNGDTQIGVTRATRINPFHEDKCGCRTPKEIPKSECTLCKEVEKQRALVGHKRMYSRHNARPFGPRLHQVVFSDAHIQWARDVTEEVLVEAWERHWELAKSDLPELDGLTVGLNCGAYLLSGASQIHFHYQVAGQGPTNFNAGDAVGEMCREYGELHGGADYLADYQAALRRTGQVIEENAHGILYVPVAQRMKHELQLMALSPGVGNLRDTTSEARKSLAQLEHRAMQIYAHLGLHSFNEVWHMTRFSTRNDFGQRLVVSFYPRTSILALYELSQNYVVDQEPWKSANELRKEWEVIARPAAG